MNWLAAMFVLAPAVLLIGYTIRRCIVQIRAAILPKTSRSKHPECGGCGYNVRGLTELKCPECGADLLDVGIIGARGVEDRLRVLSGAIAGVTLLAIEGALLTLMLLALLSIPNSGWIALGMFIVLMVGGHSAMFIARWRFRRGTCLTPPPAPPSPDH